MAQILNYSFWLHDKSLNLKKSQENWIFISLPVLDFQDFEKKVQFLYLLSIYEIQEHDSLNF